MGRKKYRIEEIIAKLRIAIVDPTDILEDSDRLKFRTMTFNKKNR